MTDSRLTDAKLRDLYARALHAPDGRKGCPDPGAIHALVRGEGDENQRLDMLDHVMSCEECSREFELLRAIDRASAENAGSVPTTNVRPIGRQVSWRRYAPLALAASIIIAAVVGLFGRDAGRDVIRGDQAAVVLVAPATEVQQGAQVQFAWRPIVDALRYELEVLDATGNAAYSATTTDTTAMLAGTTLTPGDYRWWVRTVTGAGDQRASGMRLLRVRP